MWGLPLAIALARAGFQVVGLDIDSAKTEAINRGESYIKHIETKGIPEHFQRDFS